MASNEEARSAQRRRGDSTGTLHLLKRRSDYGGPAVFRRTPQDVVDQASQVGGGLASGRGDGVVGGSPASTPAATGGLASDRGGQETTALAESSSQNQAPSNSSPPQNTWTQDHNGGQAAPSTTSQWMDNNNGNHNGDASSNQWVQPTSSQQQQHDQWQQPSSSSSQNTWNTWENHNNNNNGGNTWQNTEQQNTWQQMSSSNSWDQSTASQSSSAGSVTDTSSTNIDTSAPSSTPVLPVTAGIDNNANAAVDADGVSDASMAASKTSKLGAGGTAGIVIAILAVLGLLAAIFVYRRRKRSQAAADQDFGNGRFMSERFSTGSSFYQGANASATSGGFITFNDNASTHTFMPDATSAASIIHHSPTLTSAPPAMAASLVPRQESPDDDDASHYDQETVDEHGDLGRPSSVAYYGNAPSQYEPLRSPRMPEYNLPTPPIPAFNGEEAIMTSRSLSNNMAYIASGRPGGRRAPDDRRAVNRSISSQNSYVDEQLRDLYVGHY